MNFSTTIKAVILLSFSCFLTSIGFSQVDTLQIDSLQESRQDTLRERARIYATCKIFISERNAFFLNDDSVAIANNVTPGYLEILKIGKASDKLEEIPGKELVIKEMHTDWMEGDTTACRVRLVNYGNPMLILTKVEGQWKVCGENNFIASPQWVKRKKEDLEILREKVALREALKTQLSQAIISYLQDRNADLLRQFSTPEFFAFMEKCKIKFGKYNPDYLQVEGPMIPINLDTKIRMKGDSAAVQCLEESLYLLRENGKWKYAGFEGKFGKELTNAFLEKQFFNLLFEFQISYSAFNGDLSQVVLPEPGEEDTTVYHYMTDLLDRASFPVGPESLSEYMQNYLKPRKSRKARKAKHKKKTSFVYLSFIVEKNGSLSHIEVIKSPNKCKGKKAKKMMEGMPNWEPAMQDDQTVKMYGVLGVPFN